MPLIAGTVGVMVINALFGRSIKTVAGTVKDAVSGSGSNVSEEKPAINPVAVATAGVVAVGTFYAIAKLRGR